MKDVLAKDSTLSHTIDTLTTSVTDTRSLVTAINTSLVTLQSNIGNITTSIASLTDAVANINQRITTIEQDIIQINTVNDSQSLAITQMQDLANQLQAEISELKTTVESNTGTTEHTTIVNHYNTYIQTGSSNTGEITIINNYYITGSTNQTGSLVWTHSTELLTDIMSGTTHSGTDISPKEAYLYILDLYESATDTIENLVALQVTSIHGYFNEIWVKKINTENLVTDTISINNRLCLKKSDNSEICITGDQLESILSSAPVSQAQSDNNTSPDTSTGSTDSSSGSENTNPEEAVVSSGTTTEPDNSSGSTLPETPVSTEESSDIDTQT